MQSSALRVRLPQLSGRDALAVSGHLDIGRVVCPPLSHDDPEAGHAFPSNEANLDAQLIRTVGNHGRKARVDEIDIGRCVYCALRAAFSPEDQQLRDKARASWCPRATGAQECGSMAWNAFGAATRKLHEADGRN
jgi:hypothetical protein